jgi:alpha-ketoglutarate-dependent taurine dioxygenase
MGAEIEDVDLSAPLPDAVFAQIARAFLDHKLLVFRGQALSSGQIQAFAERFGPIEVHTVRRPDGSVLDGVHAVTNLDADGKPSQTMAQSSEKANNATTNRRIFRPHEHYLGAPHLETLLAEVRLSRRIQPVDATH